MKTSLLNKEIIKELYFNQFLSVTALSHHLNKSIPIVLKEVGNLIQEGQVMEIGLAPSTGGRRALIYSLQPNRQYIVAVAMDQLITTIALVDSTNNIVGNTEKIEFALAKNDHAVPELIEHIKGFIRSSGIEVHKITGIGIGMPGFVDLKKGLNYSFLESKNQNICNLIYEATHLPTFIDNDSSIIALAELKFGSCKGKTNALVVNIGWGVGLGMILNSELFRGSNGFAGEFSHIPLFSNNKLCSCGKMGCLETETSLSVIIEKAKAALTNGRTSVLQDQIFDVDNETAFELIVKAAQKGDQLSIEVISKAGYEIGRGIAILIHLLNPEAVVLSGRGAIAGKLWKAPIEQAIHEFSIPRLAADTKIELSILDYKAELIGAAALVMENYEKLATKHPKPALQEYQ